MCIHMLCEFLHHNLNTPCTFDYLYSFPFHPTFNVTQSSKNIIPAATGPFGISRPYLRLKPAFVFTKHKEINLSSERERHLYYKYNHAYIPQRHVMQGLKFLRVLERHDLLLQMKEPRLFLRITPSEFYYYYYSHFVYRAPQFVIKIFLRGFCEDEMDPLFYFFYARRFCSAVNCFGRQGEWFGRNLTVSRYREIVINYFFQ